MSIGAILTLGLGGFGSINLLPTLGYRAGTAPIPPPPIVPIGFVPLYLPTQTGNTAPFDGHDGDDDYIDHRLVVRRREEAFMLEAIKQFLKVHG